MSRLTDLLAQAKSKDPQLGADLEREFRVLSSRLPFGLNFERHRPEAVELPKRPVRKGDKVRVLPERGSSARGDQRLWKVVRVVKTDQRKKAELDLLDGPDRQSRNVALDRSASAMALTVRWTDICSSCAALPSANLGALILVPSGSLSGLVTSSTK